MASKVVLLPRLCATCGGIGKTFEATASLCLRCKNTQYCSEACADWTAHKADCRTQHERIDHLATLSVADRDFLQIGYDLDDWVQRFTLLGLQPTTLFSALDLHGKTERARKNIVLIEVEPATELPLYDLDLAFRVSRVKTVDANSLELYYCAESAYGTASRPGQSAKAWQEVVAQWEKLCKADAGPTSKRDQDYLIINALVFTKLPATFASLWTIDERWQARAVMARIAREDWRVDEAWLDKTKTWPPSGLGVALDKPKRWYL